MPPQVDTMTTTTETGVDDNNNDNETKTNNNNSRTSSNNSIGTTSTTDSSGTENSSSTTTLKSQQHQYEHSWEPEIAAKIKAALKERETEQQQKENDNAKVSTHIPPYMVALVGIPGGGKSISSFLLANFLENSNDNDVKEVNDATNSGSTVMIMPHDGYHYPMDQLRLMPDAADVIYRRGAPDTFDPAALKRDLERIRYGFDEEFITVPGFDHGRGDPEPDQHAFDRNHHKVVICEGLYLLHDGDGWEEIASMFDMSIFIDSDVDACVERLKIRNLCIPGYTPEEIQIRCEVVDRVNAMTVMKSSTRATDVVESIVSSTKKKKNKKTQSGTNNNDTIKNKEEPVSLASLDLVTQQQQTTGSIAYVEAAAAGGAVAAAGHHHRRQDSASHRRQESTDSDWMMSIMDRRPRSDSVSSKPESILADPDAPEPPPASAFVGSWEADMAKTILDDMKRLKESAAKPDGQPYMVALVGTPGSGKSISALLLANHLEESTNNNVRCMVMPHDGYHYTLEYLKTFPNAEDYIYRRGAPDTFDPAALARDLERIRCSDEELITLPAFDHSRGDPEPDTHAYDRSRHDIVICEGLYLLHDRDGWEDVATKFDWKIFMNSDIELCMERVKIRNQCIPGYTPEEIAERTEKVDRINSLTVLSSKARADVIVDSLAMTSHAYENNYEHEEQHNDDDGESENGETKN